MKRLCLQANVTSIPSVYCKENIPCKQLRCVAIFQELPCLSVLLRSCWKPGVNAIIWQEQGCRCVLRTYVMRCDVRKRRKRWQGDTKSSCLLNLLNSWLATKGWCRKKVKWSKTRQTSDYKFRNISSENLSKSNFWGGSFLTWGGIAAAAAAAAAAC